MLLVVKTFGKGSAMRKIRSRLYIVAMVAALWSCGKKESDPQTQLPSYLRIPATLAGYTGAGLITLNGDLSLRAEGTEHLDASSNTYSGVLGSIKGDVLLAQFTVGQPLPYEKTATVPAQYEANGELRIMNTTEPGTYPMGIDSQPTPTGVITDLTINLPGPQLFYTRTGSLTITDKTLVQQQNGNSLYRVTGTFTALLNVTGLGATPGKALNTTGTFDLLLLSK